MRFYDNNTNRQLQARLEAIDTDYPRGIDPSSGEKEAFLFEGSALSANRDRIEAFEDILKNTTYPTDSSNERDIERRSILNGCFKTLAGMGTETVNIDKNHPASAEAERLASDADLGYASMVKRSDGVYSLGRIRMENIGSVLNGIADEAGPEARSLHHMAGRHYFFMAQNIAHETEEKQRWLEISHKHLDHVKDDAFAKPMLEAVTRELGVLQLAQKAPPPSAEDESSGRVGRHRYPGDGPLPGTEEYYGDSGHEIPRGLSKAWKEQQGPRVTSAPTTEADLEKSKATPVIPRPMNTHDRGGHSR